MDARWRPRRSTGRPRRRWPAGFTATLPERLAATWRVDHLLAERELQALLERRLSRPPAKLRAALMHHLAQEQAIVCAATEIQARISRLLGRRPPARPLHGADLALQYGADQGA